MGGTAALQRRSASVPPGGGLSEGDKRDSKGDMPGHGRNLSMPLPTLRRGSVGRTRQRRLCSGASVSDSAEEFLGPFHRLSLSSPQFCRSGFSAGKMPPFWVKTLGRRDLAIKISLEPLGLGWSSSPRESCTSGCAAPKDPAARSA